MPLPLTRQEVKALVVLGVTGLIGLTALAVTRVAPPKTTPVAATVNLNAASAEALTALPGIGPVTAERIIAEREQHGRFLRVEDLARVKGMSPRVIAVLKSRLTVE